MGELVKQAPRWRLIEATPIPDIYADGIGAVELLGSCVRVILYAEHGRDRIVVAKIIRQIATIDRDRLERMIAEQLARIKERGAGLH